LGTGTWSEEGIKCEGVLKPFPGEKREKGVTVFVYRLLE